MAVQTPVQRDKAGGRPLPYKTPGGIRPSDRRLDGTIVRP
jgi:hypothetical protein